MDRQHGIRSLPLIMMLSLGGLVFNTCRHTLIQSPPEQMIALATPDARCEAVQTKRHYTFLFGISELNEAGFENFAYKSNRSYRIHNYTDWLDKITSIGLGYLLSIHSSSYELLECNQLVSIQKPADLRKEKDQALSAYLKSRAGKNQSELILKTRDGQQIAGHLHSMDDSEIILLVPDRSNSESKPTAKVSDMLTKKDGSILVGKITAQSRTSVTINTDSGAQVIAKSEIAKMAFNKTIQQKNEIEYVKKSLKRKEIERMYFPDS